MNDMKRARQLRWLMLLAILIWITYESVMHQVLGGGKAPSVHALCPYGAVESLYSLLFAGAFIKKIYTGTLLIFILSLVIALVFRRSFCGLLCPFGALQDVFSAAGRRLFGPQRALPNALDTPLRYLKYAVLALTAGMAWYLGTLWMAPYDPYSAYAHLTTAGDAIAEDPAAIVGFVLLAVTVIASLRYERFFCKYLCPAGAFYGIVGKLSPTRVVRNDDVCIACGKCSRICPVNIQVDTLQQVTSAECISCNECVAACPKKGALEVKVARRTVSPMLMLVLVGGLFFGTLWIAQVTGNLELLPAKPAPEVTVPLEELKGYMTIEEAAAASGLPLEEVYARMGIPKEVPAETKLKEISGIAPAFSLDEAKERLANPQ